MLCGGSLASHSHRSRSSFVLCSAVSVSELVPSQVVFGCLAVPCSASLCSEVVWLLACAGSAPVMCCAWLCSFSVQCSVEFLKPHSCWFCYDVCLLPMLPSSIVKLPKWVKCYVVLFCAYVLCRACIVVFSIYLVPFLFSLLFLCFGLALCFLGWLFFVAFCLLGLVFFFVSLPLLFLSLVFGGLFPLFPLFFLIQLPLRKKITAYMFAWLDLLIIERSWQYKYYFNSIDLFFFICVKLKLEYVNFIFLSTWLGYPNHLDRRRIVIFTFSPFFLFLHLILYILCIFRYKAKKSFY